MKIREFIDELKRYDQEAEICIEVDDTESHMALVYNIDKEDIEKEVVKRDGNKVYIVKQVPLGM